MSVKSHFPVFGSVSNVGVDKQFSAEILFVAVFRL